MEVNAEIIEAPTNVEQSIESITAAYAGRKMYASRRDKYRDQWTTCPMAQGEEIIKIDFSYEIMRLALFFTCVNKLKSKGKTFVINNENAKRLTKIIKAITGDIDGEYNPNKGIFLFGPPSSGKTYIMQQICHTICRAYYTGWYHLDSAAHWYSYKDITMKAREGGSIDFLRSYFDNKKIIFLDDLGYNNESQLNLYGTKENVVSHLVEVLYRKYTDQGYTIHMSSNLTLKMIHDQFGQYTHDRIVDMCTPVSWMGDNFRLI